MSRPTVTTIARRDIARQLALVRAAADPDLWQRVAGAINDARLEHAETRALSPRHDDAPPPDRHSVESLERVAWALRSALEQGDDR